MKKRLIIFDFDGVIIDSWEHAYRGNLRNWPNLQPAQHRTFFNGNIYSEIAKLPLGKYSKEEESKWWKEEHIPKKTNLKIFAGIQEIIQKLAEENTLVINTSSDSESTKKYLIEHGLDYFDAVYGTEFSKDKINKFKHIISHYNVFPQDTFFITDTVGDVLDATSLSIPTIAVTYGYQDLSYFSKVKEKILGFAHTPSEILNFIP